MAEFKYNMFYRSITIFLILVFCSNICDTKIVKLQAFNFGINFTNISNSIIDLCSSFELENDDQNSSDSERESEHNISIEEEIDTSDFLISSVNWPFFFVPFIPLNFLEKHKSLLVFHPELLVPPPRV
jgi:hypothetical protein